MMAATTPGLRVIGLCDSGPPDSGPGPGYDVPSVPPSQRPWYLCIITMFCAL